MNTINYTDTIRQYSAACATLEGEGNFNLWKASIHFQAEPFRNRAILLENHFNELAESQVTNLLTSRRETILKAFEGHLFTRSEEASEMISELAEIEITLNQL
jgi:hypothetical protein